MVKSYLSLTNKLTSLLVAGTMLLLTSGCVQKAANVQLHQKLKQNASVQEKIEKGYVNPYQHIVKPGETLYSISKVHQASIRKLIDKNRLQPPYRLMVDQVLRLPQAKFHVVKKGETLYGISRSYGVDIWKLKKTNNLASLESLPIGKALRIPATLSLAKTQKPIKRSKPAVARKRSQIKHHIAQRGSSIKTTAKTPSPQTRPKLASTKKTSKSMPKPVKRSASKNFIWPVKGKVISRFGPKKGGLYNDGINIATKEGKAVKAAESGKVAYVGNALRGYGNLVLIKHDNGYLTAYAHNSRNVVSKGTYVKRGQTIAYSGKTGHVSKPQLHFSIRKGRKAVNPEHFLKG